MLGSREVIRLSDVVVGTSLPEVLGVTQLSSEKKRTYSTSCFLDFDLPCIPEDFRCKDCGCDGDCRCNQECRRDCRCDDHTSCNCDNDHPW